MDSHAAEEYNVPFTQGVLIASLDSLGSAALAGVKKRDIVTKANGKTVTTSSELLELLGRSKVGETLTLNVVRDGDTREIPVRLKARNNN
jgi:S1-C subfamily serine protease